MDENIAYYEDLRNKKLADSSHWDYCEKNKIPYIVINKYNHKYDNIFYDITNLPYNLDEISESIKNIYLAYMNFFLIPSIDVESLLDENYFFNLYVKKEHSELIATQLFNYLLYK